MSISKKARTRSLVAAAAFVTAGAVSLITLPAHADETPVRLRNAATGDCLESFLQKNPDQPGYVYSEPCPPQGVQWRTESAGLTDGPENAVHLIDVEAFGWCLQRSDAGVFTRPCQPGDAAQAWVIGADDTIRPADDADLCLTDSDTRSVSVVACTTDDTHQQWPSF